METHTCGPPADHVAADDAELLEGAGPARFDDHVGPCDETTRAVHVGSVVEVEGDRSLAPVEQVEERAPDRGGRRRAGRWTPP